MCWPGDAAPGDTDGRSSRPRHFCFGHIASLLSGTPAKAMGLQHCKGRIAVGLDADLVIVDLDREYAFGRGKRTLQRRLFDL